MHLEMVLSAVEMYVHIVLWWRDIPVVFSYTVLRGRSPRTWRSGADARLCAGPAILLIYVQAYVMFL